MLTNRERELIARHLLANQHMIAEYLQQKKWEELVALVEYANGDAPIDLIGTDPALFRTLRNQITEFRLKWTFNLGKLKQYESNSLV